MGRITQLSFQCSPIINKRTLKRLSTECPNLETLNIHSCDWPKLNLFQHLKNCEKLAHLSIIGNENVVGELVNEEEISEAINGIAVCGILKSLRVDNCPNITESAIISIITCCKDLNRLSAAGTTKFTKKSLTALKTEMASRDGVPGTVENGRFKLNCQLSDQEKGEAGPWIEFTNDWE